MATYKGDLYVEGGDRVVICYGGSANVGRHSLPASNTLGLTRRTLKLGLWSR